MCFQFKCITCKVARYDFCEKCLMNDPAGCTVKKESPWGSLGKRCETCHTIVGVILELKSLALREPWLLTKGVAGAPRKEAWETAEEKSNWAEEEDSGGEDADGFTKEQRKKVRAEAEAAIMKRWGLLRAASEDGKRTGEGEEAAVAVSVLETASDSE